MEVPNVPSCPPRKKQRNEELPSPPTSSANRKPRRFQLVGFLTMPVDIGAEVSTEALTQCDGF
jgi:hypothetical protein